ncbi:alpha-ketoglutarate-dependent dioxygenase AlkB [Sphingomonas piscis]|uniref:alpha-ketoglutarate-dependent dioxygenase AlkB n=1 Tax=Sphingomonas piscis TaxID=2714943 RepID=UPI001FE480AE|nr:alpha-ketoglutarate-dependent dioxygenase AlkB [Sphingomonas piscis]
MTATGDLFDEPLLAGLQYQADLLTQDEHDALIAQMSAIDLPPFMFQGWEGKRRTQSFGWRYDFNDASFMRADPFPDWLVAVRDKAAAFAGLSSDAFIHALLARYDPGAGIGWHRDRPVFEQVVGISLGSPATLRFRQRTSTGFKRASLHVAPRSSYLLSGPARHEWEHSIVPGELQRFSITFRTMSALGRRKAEAQRIS